LVIEFELFNGLFCLKLLASSNRVCPKEGFVRVLIMSQAPG
jgi:hypothetical protein